MAHIEIRTGAPSLDSPVFIEGLPGVGLVGKIATDHVVAEFDMGLYGSITCPGLPKVAVYRENQRTLLPPVRLYADDERNLIALQSDVPVSPEQVSDFATCLTRWLVEQGALPLYFSGLATELDADAERSLYGVSTGDAGRILDTNDIAPPDEAGVWSGPTGALLNRAVEMKHDALGFIVESDPQFPDPEAACTLIERTINPIADVDIDIEGLRESAAEIRDEKEQFAQRMQSPAGDESSKAEPLRMFQ